MIDKIKSFFKSFFLRWKTEESLIKQCNRMTPLHRKVSNAISCIFIVIALIVWLFSFPSSAAEIQPRVPVGTVPSDLTGYTVTVPENWTAVSGFGIFNVSAESSLGGISSFAIGYERVNFSSVSPVANTIALAIGGRYTIDVTPNTSFSLTFLGGSDTSNPSLIRWLVDSGATFSNGSDPDPDPDPNPLVTFNKGLYRVNALWYNSDISTQLDGMMFYSLSEGDLFTALTVQNDELIFDDENGDMHVMARNTTMGAKWIDNSGQFVYFINDESIPQSLAEQIPTLLEYIPDVSLIDYQRMQDSWYYGVQDGFTEGYNQASRDTEGTFLGNIFGGVFDALDKFQIFGQFSFLDFIKSIIGILALIWFLKLLAGG